MITLDWGNGICGMVCVLCSGCAVFCRFAFAFAICLRCVCVVLGCYTLISFGLVVLLMGCCLVVFLGFEFGLWCGFMFGDFGCFRLYFSFWLLSAGLLDFGVFELFW